MDQKKFKSPVQFIKPQYMFYSLAHFHNFFRMFSKTTEHPIAGWEILRLQLKKKILKILQHLIENWFQSTKFTRKYIHFVECKLLWEANISTNNTIVSLCARNNYINYNFYTKIASQECLRSSRTWKINLLDKSLFETPKGW